MLPRINPTSTTAWKELQNHFSEMKTVHMRELFRNDPERFAKFSISTKDLVFDYSKNIISEQTLRSLIKLAEECKVKVGIDAMFNGEKINETENRAVLHTALRNFSNEPAFTQGKDVMPDIKKVLRQMKNICDMVHEGRWRGYSGEKNKVYR